MPGRRRVRSPGHFRSSLNNLVEHVSYFRVNDLAAARGELSMEEFAPFLEAMGEKIIWPEDCRCSKAVHRGSGAGVVPLLRSGTQPFLWREGWFHDGTP